MQSSLPMKKSWSGGASLISLQKYLFIFPWGRGGGGRHLLRLDEAAFGGEWGVGLAILGVGGGPRRDWLRLSALRLPALRLPALRLPALRLPALRLPALRLPALRCGLSPFPAPGSPAPPRPPPRPHLEKLLDARDARGAPHQDDVVDRALVHLGVAQHALLHAQHSTACAAWRGGRVRGRIPCIGKAAWDERPCSGNATVHGRLSGVLLFVQMSFEISKCYFLQQDTKSN